MAQPKAQASMLRVLPLTLAAAAPLLGFAGLGVAQEPGAATTSATAPAAPASVPPAAPAAGAQPAPAEVQAPLTRPKAPAAGVLRPNPAPVAPPRSQRAATPLPPGPEPSRFDRSLDALVRDGIVTPAERDRVRAGARSTPFNVPAHAQACSTGALSEQECRTGLAVRWRGRPGSDTAAPGGDGAPLQGLMAGTALTTPLTVPVSALLAGAGGGFRLADVFAVSPRPAPIRGNGNRSLLFPLIGSAVTSSGFGYRLHPVLGSWLMHAGRDLAAPEGTPVVAALSGTVISSGVAGGYGLAIEVEHDRPRRRTLYGHLSELYVKPGDRVRQGEVIGRVGSTGLSTGPHLHFELRVPGDGGWLAVDPGDLDPGQGAVGSDAIAVLMGQLLQSLERPVSPLAAPAQPGAAKAG